MRVVIDTNCMLSCIGKKSPYRNVFDAFLNKEISICASNEILAEYEEMFTKFWSAEIAGNLLALFEASDNFEYIHIYYNWQLTPDEDDNKFADAYISSNSEFIISQDSDLQQLNSNEFPVFRVLPLKEFSSIIRGTLRQ